MIDRLDSSHDDVFFRSALPDGPVEGAAERAAPLRPAPDAGPGADGSGWPRPSAEPTPAAGDASYHEVRRTGPSDNRIDIWFVGDGYTEGQVDLLIADAEAQFEWMVTEAIGEPFGAYADLFNVHVVFVASAEEGADRPDDGVYVDTAFGASYSWDGETERLLYMDAWAAEEAVAAVLPDGVDVDMRFGVVNADLYGGGGGFYAVYAAGNENARAVALHEIGHSFAGLADEYWEAGAGAHGGWEPFEANVTADPTGAKWAHWMGFDDGVLGPIGVFEGGLYAESGVFRPTDDSLMRSLDRPFDAVAREQFVLNFYQAVDPLDAWSFDDAFLVSEMYERFWADPVSDEFIQQEWYVDGEMVATGRTLDMVALGFGAGTYDVSVRAFDDSPFVRVQRDLLEQTVSWRLELGYDAQRGSDVADVLEGTEAADRLDGLGGDDVLAGGFGADELLGGAGNDLLYGDSSEGTA